MAEEAPVKLIQIGPKGGTKKDGFNLVTERVVAVNPEAKQLEVELLAYDGKTVVLDVGDEALEDFLKIKPGDGATIRVVEEGGKRIAKSFRIRAKDPNAAKADAMLIDLKDSHWLNRKYAAEVLGELKDPRAVLPLVEALTDEVGDVRQRAYDSLIKIGGSPSRHSCRCWLLRKTTCASRRRKLSGRSVSRPSSPSPQPWRMPMIG